MNKKDKHQDKDNKKIDKDNKNDVNLDKLDMDERNTKGDGKMEAMRERENVYSVKDKLKILSLKTREKRLEMKQRKCTEKNSNINEELASIQQNIYNTIK